MAGKVTIMQVSNPSSLGLRTSSMPEWPNPCYSDSTFSPRHSTAKIFGNYLKPVMLAFNGKL